MVLKNIFPPANPFCSLPALVNATTAHIHHRLRKLEMSKLQTGNQLQPQQWRDAHNHPVDVPHTNRWTHIQFRRYSGCAVCNLHLHSFITRQQELESAGIQEIVVFNSTQERILADLPTSPFHLIADPHNRLYQQFGVAKSLLAVFNPAVWLFALRGALKFGVQLPRDNETSFGLPADFLVNAQGKLAAVYYGTHANDQWSFDEVLFKVRELSR